MRKIISIIMVPMILFGINSTFASEPTNDSNDKIIGNYFRVTENGRQHIQEHISAEFEVEMKLNKSMDIDILYSVDDWKSSNKHSVHVPANIWNVEKVSISHLPKDVYTNFQVRIENDGTLLHEATLVIALVDFYPVHPMDKYSTLGVCSYYRKTYYQQLVNDNELGILEMVGAKKVRPGWIYRWQDVETNGKGEYEWEAESNYFTNQAKNLDLSLYFAVSGTNPNYECSGPPTTPEQVKGISRYAKEMLRENGDMVHAVEAQNEPNLRQFWNIDDPYGEAYVTGVKELYHSVKEYDPDMPVVAGVVSDSGGPFLSKLLDRGMADYVNAIAFHPYMGVTDPDDGLGKFMGTFDERADAYGDWLDVYVSEMGWASVLGTSLTPELMGVHHLKGQIESDAHGYDEFILYQLVNQGINQREREYAFGIATFAGFEPKEGFSVVSNTFGKLNHARFIGRFRPSGDSVINVYQSDGKVFAVAWTTVDDATVEYTFDGTNIKVEDYDGNPIDIKSNKIEINNNPRYILNLSDKIVDIAIRDEVSNRIDNFIGKYGEIVPTDKIAELKSEVLRIRALNEISISKLTDMCYKYGDTLIDQYKISKDFTIEQLGVMLCDINDIGTKIALLYGKYQNKGECVSKLEIADIRAKILKNKNNEKYASQPLTERMVFRSNKFARRAEDEAKVKGYEGLSKADGVISRKILNWAKQFMEFEPVKEGNGIIAYTDSRTLSVYQEEEKVVNISMDNKLSRDVKGKIVVNDSKGNVLGNEIENVNLKSGKITNVSIPIVVGKNSAIGKDTIHIQFIENDKVMTDQIIETQVLSMCDVKLMQATTNFDKLKKLDVAVENKSERDISAVVKLEAPDGWQLEQDTLTVKVEKGKTNIVSYNIVKKKPVAFNEYSFKLSAQTESGQELVSSLVPLDFAVMVKADKPINIENFDGDLTDWANAYPIHAGAPQRGSTLEDWKNSNVALRAFTKWDDKNVYVLCDVYDGHHVQAFTGGSMWNGDSIQLAFDPFNDGIDEDGAIIPNYLPDDSEITFAKTPSGEDETYVQKAADGTAAGERADYVKIVRDENNHITRYLIKIPASEIALKVGLNEKFGMNAVANDSDTLARERFVAVTRGLGDYKAPGHYYTFVCAPFEPAKVSAILSKDYVVELNK